jgi:hypothetical protein
VKSGKRKINAAAEPHKSTTHWLNTTARRLAIGQLPLPSLRSAAETTHSSEKR